MPDLGYSPPPSRSVVRATQQRWARTAARSAIVLSLAATIGFGVSASPYWLHIGILTALAVILSVSIRPLLVAGEASFCHGAFYAMGAYTVGILTTKHGFPVWPTILLGGFAAILTALAIGLPSLRTTGPYFFLITFGFLVVLNAAFGDLEGITGGHVGIAGIPSPTGVSGLQDFYFLALALALATIGCLLLVDRSRWGLELRCLGGGPDLAQAAGVARFSNMVGAFALGAFFSGLAGGVYASYIAFIAPDSFSFWLSVYILTYVVVGGARYVLGAIVGAIVIASIPVAGSFSEAYVGIFAAAVTLGVMMLLPRGIVVEAVELARRWGIEGRAGVAAVDISAIADRERPSAADSNPPRSVPSAAPGEALLKVSQVSKSYAGLDALADVNLCVHGREAVGIIGPNGAGKTTLFNVISGFEPASAGTVTLDGNEITGIAPHRVTARGLTRTFQSSSVFEGLTVLENVVVACGRRSQGRVARVLRPIRTDRSAITEAVGVLDLFDMREWGHERAEALPYGLRRILGVAIAVATEPRVLCLDEPVAGLSDPEVERMVSVLDHVRAETQVSLLLIEHRVPVVTALCDRIVALNSGRVIAEGRPSEVISHPDVVEAYLGPSADAASGQPLGTL